MQRSSGPSRMTPIVESPGWADWGGGAGEEGARVILPPELFQASTLPGGARSAFARATSVAESAAVKACRWSPGSWRVLIPTSFFEKDGPHYYN